MGRSAAASTTLWAISAQAETLRHVLPVVERRFRLGPHIGEFVHHQHPQPVNYTEDRYEREHELHPNWIFFGSETFSANLDKNWALVSRHPYVIGDFSWTAWDYLGEVGCGRIEPKTQPGQLQQRTASVRFHLLTYMSFP